MVTEETSIKSACKDYLNLMGVFNYALLQGMGSYKGIPDRIMHYKGGLVVTFAAAKRYYQPRLLVK